MNESRETAPQPKNPDVPQVRKKTVGKRRAWHRIIRAVSAIVVVAAVAAAVAWWKRTEPNGEQSHQHASTEHRAGVVVEKIAYRQLSKEIRTVGKLDYDENRVAYIAARVPGRIDRLYVGYAGVLVKAGDHLVDIYSPTLNVDQASLIRSLEAVERGGPNSEAERKTLEGIRERLRLLGVMPQQIEEIERTRKATNHLTVYAPIGGTVIEKDDRARLGQYLEQGDPLYRIADLDPIWLYLDVYEYDIAWVRYGQAVTVTVEAFPGEEFQGMVTFIDPFLDDKTRAVKVRVNLKNADGKLKPAMYATATIRVRLRADGTAEPTGLEGKFFCPMHPEIVRDKAGRCPIVGSEALSFLERCDVGEFSSCFCEKTCEELQPCPSWRHAVCF